MRSQFGRWSLPIIGLGVGVGVGVGVGLGWAIGRIGPVVAVVVVVVGLGIAIAGTRQADQSSPEFAASQAQRKARRAELAHARLLEDAARPTLAGLGTRVEQILHLAEEQANDHRSEAKRESDQILAAAHREAEEIISHARALAGEADQPPRLDTDQR